MKSNASKLLLVEVTGTERKRGDSYWVRPDKLRYLENHPEEDVWIVLHFAEPEQFVFIKPEAGKKYAITVKKIRDADEHYVEFFDNNEEIKSPEEFFENLRAKLNVK